MNDKQINVREIARVLDEMFHTGEGSKAMKLYKNDTTEVYPTDSYSRVTLGVHSLKQPDHRAMFAMDLIRSMGAALVLDTHPGATRLTPDEVAKVASDISAAAFFEIEKRGWFVEVPSMEKLSEEARENRGRN